MSKKLKVDGEDAHAEIQAQCEEMQRVQSKLEDVEAEFDKKVLELQSEFNVKKTPLYIERNAIISKIPNFWYIAFTHSDIMRMLLHRDDEHIFKHITSLVVEEKEDIKSGFKITVTFSENSFFTNRELWKELTFTDTAETKIDQSGVDWKPNQGPNKASNAAVGEKRDRDEESFFNAFFNNADKDHVDMANIIKDDLWPNPLRYYTGEVEDDFDEEEEDFDDDFDEEEEVEEAEEDEAAE
uniref:Uncharacterized protein n=1 Tax=Eutreptiella gymnastica TaxID=73025 RepID=A0A7S1IY29_9EUGL|mmetsp:Transcript_50469/g.90257  ORF Transcript_50469/g.90257 Transcript_50469/m.90257 type:complete len:240 (+) Transcript_50469:61-780(+)